MIQTNPREEEYLDLVNSNDIVIGNLSRSEVYKQNIHNFRVVSAFIKNSKGELWIPRRVLHKILFPLCLDMSMGGHVSSGETYEEALFREVEEELNIDLNLTPYKYIGSMNPHEHGTSSYGRVYEISSDEVPGYNQNDFIEYFWLKPQELLDRLAKGDKSKSDLPKIIKHFYIDL